MSTTVFNLVELQDGTIALQPADGKGAPLVSVRFSQEARRYMPLDPKDMVKVMLRAAAEFIAQMQEEGQEKTEGSSPVIGKKEVLIH